MDSKEKKIIELDRAMEEPTFWDDPKESTKIVREAKQLKDTVEKYNKLKSEYEDIGVLIEMGYEENDESLIPEIEGMLEALTRKIDDLKKATLLTGEYDSSNAIMKLNAGALNTSHRTRFRLLLH